jgi:hypothetical protein
VTRAEWYRKQAELHGRYAAAAMRGGPVADTGGFDFTYEWARMAGHFGNLALDA